MTFWSVLITSFTPLYAPRVLIQFLNFPIISESSYNFPKITEYNCFLHAVLRRKQVTFALRFF